MHGPVRRMRGNRLRRVFRCTPTDAPVGDGVPDGPFVFPPKEGIFRAPARQPFARGGKRVQKRRQRPMVFGIPFVLTRLCRKKAHAESLLPPSPLPLPRPALIVRCSKNSGPLGRTYTCRRWRQVRDLIIAIAVSQRTPARNTGAAAIRGPQAIRCTTICAMLVFAWYRAAGFQRIPAAQEVLKPAVSSSVFGHFWGCGQKWPVPEGTEHSLSAVGRNGAAGDKSPKKVTRARKRGILLLPPEA